MTTVAKQNRNRNKNGLMLNNLFDNLFDDDLFGFMLNEPTSAPQYDVIENDNEYILEFMLPGFEKDSVSINVEEDTLFIEGERKADENVKYNRKGSFYGKFKRSFTLPENVETNEIDASFQDGVLSIKLPKRSEKEVSKKSIKIN